MLIRRALEHRAADPRAEFGNSTPPPPGDVGGSGVAGTSVSEGSALQIAAVYGSVSVIADSLSSLPIDLMDSPHRRSGTSLPPSQLVADPYVEISVLDWWVQFAMSLALRGNFYGQIVDRDKSLYPTQIKPIHPDHAQVRRVGSGQVEYRFNGRRVSIDDVFHVRYLSVSESLVGLNPIEYLRNVFGGALASDQYGNAFFANSARADVVLEMEDELDAAEAVKLAKAWKAAHQGIGRSSLPAVLTGGLKLTQPITVSPQDAQFLETRQYSAGSISGQIFRVPPHMIGIVDKTTSWGTGIEQQELGFVRNTLVGYLSRGERALTSVHPRGQFVKFDLSERLRGDKLQRFTAYSLGRLGGWLNADEIRAAEDQPPLPNDEGQEYLVPINSELLSQAVKLAQQQISQQQAPPAADDIGGDGQ